MVLRGLPKEFAHFCSAIHTRSDPISYEQLSIMLQSEERAMMDNSDSIPHSLAMFASNSKPNGNGSFTVQYVSESRICKRKRKEQLQ